MSTLYGNFISTFLFYLRNVTLWLDVWECSIPLKGFRSKSFCNCPWLLKIVVHVNPSCSCTAFSMDASSFAALLEGLSNRTLPLEITVLTLSKPSFSKTPRNLLFRMFGLVGAIPRTPSWRTVPGKEQHTGPWFVSEWTRTGQEISRTK